MKNTEELRQSLGLSQVKFCKEINMALRTYQGRLDGGQPKWYVHELIKIAQYNNGEIKLNIDGKDYEFTVKEI